METSLIRTEAPVSHTGSIQCFFVPNIGLNYDAFETSHDLASLFYGFLNISFLLFRFRFDGNGKKNFLAIGKRQRLVG
jgi:hypothetical protein